MDRRTFLSLGSMLAAPAATAAPRTKIAIEGDRFLINGRPTYEGRRIEGLLMNSRMVQGVFDDFNPSTRGRWVYPDTHRWDPERNTREFIQAMPLWRNNGLLSFTICLQGGSPQGYSKEQPWETGAFEPDGAIRPAYLSRLRRILDRADELGMAPIVSYFYFGQDERLKDEDAVKRAARNATAWLLRQGYRNLLIDAVNECDVARYDHAILTAPRVHELMAIIRGVEGASGRLLIGTSFGGGKVPTPNVIAASDFVLLHGNGVKDPRRITAMVAETRKAVGYRKMPVLFNEDDHFDFEQPENNMLSAVAAYASWGYFDPGESNYRDGYQCPPVNWGINTDRKRAFFKLLRELAGSS